MLEKPTDRELMADIYEALNGVPREFVGFIPAPTVRKVPIYRRVAFWAVIAIVVAVTLGLFFGT